MGIWKKLKGHHVVIFFILVFMIIGNLNTNTISRHVSMEIYDENIALGELNDPDSSESIFQGASNYIFSISQDGEIINESFNESYNLINPGAVIDNDLTGKNVTIAVLDSGINANPWINPDNLIGNYTTLPNSTLTSDDNGHGTFVASIIGKIAPDAKLISIKVTDSNGFSTQQWIQDGLEIAFSLKPSIIHASLGSTDFNSINFDLLDEIIDENISLVFAAGNFGPFGSSMLSPSIYSKSISVGMAYNRSRVIIESSSGPRPVGLLGPDLVAPGYNITGYSNDGTAKKQTGSSFAASIVTGSIALLQEAFPNIAPEILKAAIMETTSSINDTSPVRQGSGFLDLSKAYFRLTKLETEPLLVFIPRQLSSNFIYFGHGINGEEEWYNVGLFSSINASLKSINSSSIAPIELNWNNISQNIHYGLNLINLSIKIPDNLNMENRGGNVSFILSENLSNNSTIETNLSILIENRYPGGNVLFFQGKDNDTFIPSGPTGSFSHLKLLLQQYYGMHVSGVIRNSQELKSGGSLRYSENIEGNLTEEDLYGQDILVLADIEYGLSLQEIELIQDWISEGHSLLILSYPSLVENGKELLSSYTSLNVLLQPYGISIEDDDTKPEFTRFKLGQVSTLEPIFEESLGNFEFSYFGTSLTINPDLNAKVLARGITSNDELSDKIIAAYWEDESSKGKVVVFGGESPFSNPNFYSSKIGENLLLTRGVFRWLIKAQQIPLDLLITPSPSLGSTTTIQIEFKENLFNEPQFNGTILQNNGTHHIYTQLIFKKSFNVYVASWKPVVAGQAYLWLNLKTSTKAPTNGIFIFEVIDGSSSNIFMILFFGGLIALGVAYYFYSSRRPQQRSPIEDKMAIELRKQKPPHKTIRLETLERCVRCQTPRYAEESKYCYQCGKEL